MRWWVPLMVVLAWLWAGEARAEEHRYAIVIGANHGHRDEEALRFAERDAQRMAEVLRRLGGFADENVVVLEGVTAARAQRVLEEVGHRIRREAGDEDSLLFVYYSGHADHAALHLGDTDLSFGTLERTLTSTAATLRVLVVDACRSGEITRVKGAVPAESFEFQAQNQLQTEGLAIITSSAAGEDAQESDRLGGGVFTHHFVNGLAGAADASADGRITLTEAYRYGYDQTLATTSRARFVQHPTYSFALKGRDEVVVTRLADDRGLGRLRLSEAGAYVVFSGGRKSEVVAELAATPKTDLLLAPGTYVVRRRDETAVGEVRARVAAGHLTTVEDRHMTRVPYGTTVRKGYAKRKAVAGALTTSFELAGPFVPELGLGYYPDLGLKLDLRQLALHPRLRYGYSASPGRPVPGQPDPVAVTQHLVGLDLAVLKLFDTRRLAPGIGIRAGGDFVRQRFRTDGYAPPRGQLVGRFGPLVRLEYAPVARLLLSVDVGADVYVLRLVDAEGRAPVTARVAPYGGLGLGVYLF